MTKSDLIKELSKEKGLPMTEARDAVNVVFDGIAKTLKKGDRVELRGFGSFKVKKYKRYKGRNPKTGEVIKVKTKKLPVFKCGKELKEMVAAYRKSKRREILQKREAMRKQLEKRKRAQAAKRAKAKATVSASSTLLAIIRRSKKGVDTAALKKKTGFEERKIWNVINSLKSRDLIKSGGRGIYIKA